MARITRISSLGLWGGAAAAPRAIDAAGLGGDHLNVATVVNERRNSRFRTSLAHSTHVWGRPRLPVSVIVTGMDTVLDRPWTTDSFLAWEDQQEGKYEFDGRHVIPMTGGSIAHQRIVFNLCLSLMGVLGDRALTVIQEMRLRAGTRIRYPDVVVCAGPLDQTTRTLADAVAIFEVLSDDTAVTDRVEKLIDYTAVPSLRAYVLLEQTAVAATLFQREPGGAWTASAHMAGALVLPALAVTLPLEGLYQGLTFPA